MEYVRAVVPNVVLVPCCPFPLSVVLFSFLFVSYDSYTVLFVQDGSSWHDVRVLEAAVRDLRGVTSLSAAADLDIGDFSLK